MLSRARFVLPALLLFSGLTLGSGVAAQCTFVGNQWPPSPWVAANSPYCVIGNVALPPNLVIGPGVEVHILGAWRITATGTLTVNGTAAAPVKFKPMAPATTWRGLVLPQAGSTLTYCSIVGATESGIQILDANTTLDHCVLCGNVSDGHGGGLRITQPANATGVVTLRDCQILRNRANGANSHGGGVFAALATARLVVERCDVMDNRASGHGGGLWLEVGATSTVTMRECDVARNAGNVNGADGRYVAGGCGVIGDATIERCVFRGNYTHSNCQCHVEGCGGGLYLERGTVTLRACALLGNTVDAYARGGFASFTYGGGLYVESNSVGLACDNCLFACNSVRSYLGSSNAWGGGAFVRGGNATFNHCTFANNNCIGAASGCGLYRNAGTVAVTNSVAYYNKDNGRPGAPLGGTISCSFSCIEFGCVGTGNLSGPPGFLVHQGCSVADLAITGGSICVDTGMGTDCANGPSFGTTAADMGHLGGPLGCLWGPINLPGPLTLTAIPAASGVGTVTFRPAGGAWNDAGALLLVGVNGAPWAPVLMVSLPAFIWPSGTWLIDVVFPTIPPGLSSVTFQAVSLNYTRGIFFSNPVVVLTEK